MSKSVSLNEYVNMMANIYGRKRAKKSGRLLIDHITQGIAILNELNATEDSKKAFAIHPIFQPDDYIEANSRNFSYEWLEVRVLILVMEYRAIANSYLPTPETIHFSRKDMPKIFMPEVRNMLIADKKQNQKDFLNYQNIDVIGAKRYNQLETYFRNWLEYLESI